MNKAQKAVQKASLNDEKKTIRELKQVYSQAKKDVEERIRNLSSRTDMENLQSIIYQKKYQEALKKQIDDVLDKLNTGQIDTISEYLNVCYENGYIGSMYDLQNQGIPLTVPIDQKKVLKALQTDTKLSSRKYKGDPLKGRLAEDIDKLKLSIRAELSRSAANGSSWNEVAVKIAMGMNNPFDKAYRSALLIARTEGHRIQQSATLDALHVAKDKGADVVKQWDSTLDGLTRPAHREADGQIRELDEFFDVWGEKMKAPAIGGSAKNVCNCRCVLLQRAKWSLNEVELETLKKRASFFGLDKSQSFEDFKQKYLKLPDKADSIDLNKAVKLTSEMTSSDVDKVGRHNLYEHWEEYRQKFLGNASEVDFDNLDSSFMYDTVKLGRYKDKEVVGKILTQVDELSSQFYSPLQKLSWMDKTETTFTNAFASSNHSWGVGSAEIRFNPIKLGKDGLERISELSKKGYSVKIPKGKEVEYLVTHEFGHTILNVGEQLPSKSKNFVQCDFAPVKKARKEIDGIWNAYTSEVTQLETEYKTFAKELDTKFLFELTEPTQEEKKELAEKRNKLETVKISSYSLTNSDEFVAEAFADVVLNGEDASKYSKDVYAVINKHFGKD